MHGRQNDVHTHRGYVEATGVLIRTASGHHVRCVRADLRHCEDAADWPLAEAVAVKT